MSLQKIAVLISFFGLFLANAAAKDSSATVSYKQDFPQSNPEHFEITVGADGQGSYSSNGQLSSATQPGDPETFQFALSNNIREQIFSLAQKAHYFSGKVDSGNGNIANTGKKTLSYKDEKQSGEATYNYSPVPAIQQLTSIFQNLSTTLEFGRRLTFFHKYQKTAIDEDLKRMEDLQRSNNLGDIHTIATVLNSIANDQTVMNISRSRARRLLASAGK